MLSLESSHTTHLKRMKYPISQYPSQFFHFLKKYINIIFLPNLFWRWRLSTIYVKIVILIMIYLLAYGNSLIKIMKFYCLNSSFPVNYKITFGCFREFLVVVLFVLELHFENKQYLLTVINFRGFAKAYSHYIAIFSQKLII